MRFTYRLTLYIAATCLALLVGIAIVANLIRKDPAEEVPPPNSVIVSKSGRGQYKTISQAIKDAQPGVKILVRPGAYEEKLIIDNPVEILGDPGETGKAIIIQNTSSACVSMETDHATIKGFTLRVRAGIKGTILKLLRARNTIEEPCVDISQGQLVLEDCDITSEAVAGIGVREPTASAMIRRCTIHDGNSNGIWVTNDATAVIEDCDILGTNWAGIRIEYGANATVRRCKIHLIQNAGIVVTDHAKGTIEECEIFGNAFSGVEVRDDGNAAVRSCSIHDCRDHAIYVHNYGTGSVEDCEIFNNSQTDVSVNNGATIVVKQSKIYGGPGSGIFVYDGAYGTIEDCEIFGHQKYQEVVVKGGAEAVFTKCRIHDGKAGGVLVLEDALGTLEECDIYFNSFTGAWVRQNGSLSIRKCNINRNAWQAVAVHDNASLTIENSDLTANNKGPWDIQPGCEVRRSSNKE
jgi:F-box protein 11